MIKHCVFIRFQDAIGDPERDSLYREIHRLQNHLPGWLGYAAGPNQTIEAGMDKGFNGGFIIDFADEPARDAYLQDEEHQRVGNKIVSAARGGIDGIMVFDLFCDSP